MSSLGRFVIGATFAVGVFASSAFAVGFQPVSPEELKMTSEPQAPGAPAIILYRQVDRDDNGQRSHEDDYVRIKVLTEQGRDRANVEIAFDRRYFDVINIHARTIQPDGSIVNFDGKVFEKTIEKSKGLKIRAKTFVVPNVQVGSIIEYFYTVAFNELYIFDSNWILSEELFTKKAQFSLKPYTLKPHESIFLNPFRVRSISQRLPAGQEAKQGDDGTFRLEAGNIPAVPTEDFTPPENELKERVYFVYVDDTAERDPDKFWKHYGKKQNDALEGFIGKRKAMESLASQIVSPGDTPDAKLRKIYDKVQAIRNTSFELEKTEQEEKRAKEKEADNAEDVWKRGYGTRKQLTWLYLALVRAAGFEAYGCLLSNRKDYFFVPVTMEDRKLSENVVLVKSAGKDIYLDPGIPFTPFGLLPWQETGAQGLRLDKDGGAWFRTPLPASAESAITRTAKLKLSDSGSVEGKLTVTYTGLEAMSPRFENRFSDDVARKKFLEDAVVEMVPVATQVELVNKPDWSSSSQPLMAEFDIKIPGWASSAGKRAVFPVGVFDAGEKKVFTNGQRIHPICFEHPYSKVDDVSVELPSGWQVTSLPPGRTQDGHIVVYNLKVENNNGSLHLTRKLNVDIGILDQKYYPALRSFFQIVRTGDEEQIVLQPGTSSASN